MYYLLMSIIFCEALFYTNVDGRTITEINMKDDQKDIFI